MRLAAALALLAALAAGAQAKDRLMPRLAPEPEQDFAETQLIDLPTASSLEYGSLALRSRFTSGGGLVTWLSAGVIDRFSIGGSLNVDRLIGTQNPLRVRAPAIQARYRAYDGSKVLPALALGYDGQGWFYNDLSRKYNEKQRGVYAVGSMESPLKGLWVHPGLNIEDFDDASVFAFIGLSYNVLGKAVLLAEWDHLLHSGARFNLGARLSVVPSVQLDLALREIGSHSAFPDGVSHSTERVVQAHYVGSF